MKGKIYSEEEREKVYERILEDLEKKEMLSTLTPEEVIKTLGRLLAYLTEKEIGKTKKECDGFEWNVDFNNILLVSILELYDDQGKTFETIEETKFPKEFQDKFFKIKEALRPYLKIELEKNRKI